MLTKQGLIKYSMKQISFNNIQTRSPKIISAVGMHNSWRGCRRYKRITPWNQMFWFSFTAS